MWCVIMLASLIQTVFELHHNFTSTKSSLIIIFYHTFLLLSKSGSYLLLVVFHKNKADICFLLNSFCNDNILKSPPPYLNKNDILNVTKNKLFFVLLVTCAISVVVFYIILYPIGVFAMPCLHKSCLVVYDYQIKCISPLFRTYIATVQLAFVIPVASISSIVTTSCLLTLKEICTTLKILW